MQQNHDSDFSLRELVLKLREYAIYCLGKWKFLLAASLLFALFSLFLNWGQNKRYTASLSFMLNIDERGMNSGLGSILGQFGLSASTVESNLDKIMELSKARVIAESAFMDSVAINGINDLLANHLIANMETEKTWSESSIFSFSKDSLSLDGFRFTDNNIQDFNLVENKALKRLHYYLMGNDRESGQFHSEYNELSGIMEMRMRCQSEELSIATVNKLFEHLSQFYIDKSTEKQKYEYEILLEKYDSINNELSSVQYTLAGFEDSNKEIFRKQDLLRKNRLKVQEQKLQFMSSKAEEQLQLAKIALDNKTPYIQLIDSPISPIKPDNKPLVLLVLFGALLGLVLGIAWLSIRKMYREIINSEQYNE